MGKQSAKAHFQRRALDRHGIVFRGLEYECLVNDVKRGNAEFLDWTPERDSFRSFYRLKIQGKLYVVLYDFELDSLITIYHNSWLKQVGGRWDVFYKNTKKRLHAQQRAEQEFRLMKKLGVVK